MQTIIPIKARGRAVSRKRTAERGIIILLAWWFLSGEAVHPRNVDPEGIESCHSRCASLTGEASYRCIKTCLTAIRKKQADEGTVRKSRYNECDVSCAMHQGLEKTKCVRVCMESPEMEKGAKKTEHSDQQDPCQARCGILSGSDREKCMARCRRGNPPYRNPLRFKSN